MKSGAIKLALTVALFLCMVFLRCNQEKDEQAFQIAHSVWNSVILDSVLHKDMIHCKTPIILALVIRIANFIGTVLSIIKYFL